MQLRNSEKAHFLDLLLASGALRFGEFKTKSGRLSPFFLNAGSLDDGQTISSIAECYASVALSIKPSPPWHLYGPAYKGIVLASATAQALSARLSQPVPFTFNRKEIKDHGEGGVFIGRALTNGTELTVIEDVLTGGTSARETLALISPTGAKISTMIVGVDREERGTGDKLARDELRDQYGIDVHSMLTLSDIVHLLWKKPRLGKVWIDDDTKAKIDAYRAEFGTR